MRVAAADVRKDADPTRDAAQGIVIGKIPADVKSLSLPDRPVRRGER